MFSRVWNNYFAVATGLLLTIATAVTASAQNTDALTRLTANPGFMPSTAGWNGDNAVLSVIPRDFTPDGSQPGDLALGTTLARLSVVGAFSQWVVIDSSQPHQIITIQAFRDGPDWAGFGVTYLDGFGEEVGRAQTEIFGPSGATRGSTDGLVPYSLSALVPEEAVVAVIWVYNSNARTQVFFDEFALFNYERPNPNNVLVNGFELGGLNGDPAVMTGTEFFLPGSDASVGAITPAIRTLGGFKGQPTRDVPAIAIGQPNDFTIAYQPVRVQPGVDYKLVFNYTDAGFYGTTLGFDFYDASGNEIGEAVLSLRDSTSNPFFAGPTLDFTPPPGTVSANFWIFNSPSANPVRFSTLNLRVE